MTAQRVAGGVWCVTAGTFPANSYIVRTGPSTAVLVDAGLDPVPIEAALRELGLAPSHVLCTHGHFDHLGSAADFQGRYGAEILLHPADLPVARRNNFLLMAMKLDERMAMPRFAPFEAEPMQIGERSFAFRHTPGHTPGSCVIVSGQDWFTGDTLFARGVGLSKLPGERPSELKSSIVGLWDELECADVHPGHGPSAAGAAVKHDNQRLRTFIGVQTTAIGSRHAI